VTDTADVVIVGGGIEGAAAAWALAQRGVTDVFVAERNTVGSGMTGKSSGIVRCHYGVSSLAAMATVGLEVFEKAEEIFGTDIGFRQTGYVVGVGEPNVDSMRKSLAAQRAVGVQTEEIDHSEVARMWPFADLSPFAAFGWEGQVPDPQDEATFQQSQLQHHLKAKEPHAKLLRFYKELIRVRNERGLGGRWHVWEYGDSVLLLFREDDGCRFAAVFNFASLSATVVLPEWQGLWKQRIYSADRTWSGPGEAVPGELDLSKPYSMKLHPHSFVAFEELRSTSEPT